MLPAAAAEQRITPAIDIPPKPQSMTSTAAAMRRILSSLRLLPLTWRSYGENRRQTIQAFCLLYLEILEKFQTMRVAGEAGIRKAPADTRKSAHIFKVPGNPNRLFIVGALGGGKHCVADLTRLVGFDMSAVPNHLPELRGACLMADERRGAHVFYTPGNSPVAKILGCLEDFQKRGV